MRCWWCCCPDLSLCCLRDVCPCIILTQHAGNIMSLLLVEHSPPPTAPLQLAFYNINRLMTLEFQAIELITSKGSVYRSLVAISQRCIEIMWRFEPFKGSMKVFIRPNLADAVTGSLRVETQRGFVDLLRVINNCNRDKNKTMSYLITELNFVEMCTIFALEHLIDLKLVRRLIKATLQQLPDSISRLLAALKPFLQRNLILQQDNISKTAKLFLEKSYKLLLLSRFNQIKQKDQHNCRVQKGARLLRVEEIEKKLEYARSEAHKKIKDAFKIMVAEDCFLQEREQSDFIPYSQWLNRNKLSAKKKEKEQKNIFGIKIIEESCVMEKERAGSHCRLTLSRYKVIIMISLNIEVNKQLQQMKTATGFPLISPQVLKVEKQLEMMKKVVKNADKQEAINSFENELDFIVYIKEKCCRYISTYYWEYEKKREEMKAILMEHYPHNLREMLHSQGKYLSFREKLALVQTITAALNWLANNYACHRDIKPDNIMISPQRIPKLIDFGSCCPVYGIGTHYFTVKEARLLGTPQYYHSYDESIAFAYRRAEYEQHPLFDVFSLGRVMRDIFEDGLPHLLPNLEALINYIIERCEEADPIDRLTFQQILFLIDNLLRYFDWLEQE